MPAVSRTSVPHTSRPHAREHRRTTRSILSCARLAVGAALVATGASVLSAPASSAAARPSTVTWAEHPGSAPNYIFPMVTSAQCSVVNLAQFQNLLYRNLYFFGRGGGADTNVGLNTKLSIGKPPVYSHGDKTVTISLKTYKWSNGERVDATDVLFYLNMLRAAKSHYCYWFNFTTLALPTIVNSAKVVSPETIVLTLKKRVSQHWFTYNELSQVTPMPMAWDVTSLTGAPSSGGCAKAVFGTGDTQCTAVYRFLSIHAGFNPTKPTTRVTALSSYATSKIWSVVDGPFKLSSFKPTAPITMVPNTSYSGPNKPTIAKFVEKPFASDTAEYNALVAGTVQVGYLPNGEITSNARPPKAPGALPREGTNNPRLRRTFVLEKSWPEEIASFPVNFNSNGDDGQAGAIFSQLYIRQALQLGVDQPAYTRALYKGYAAPDYGPIPPVPPNPYVDKIETNNPYPFDIARGRALLSSHGWKVTAHGTDVCMKPGSGRRQCGKGIRRGAKLAFTYLVVSTAPTPSIAAAEKASWSAEGIDVSVTKGTFTSVISNAVRCKKTTKVCKWEMLNWGGATVFFPNHYPTGEEMFAPGAAGNTGFTTAHATALIKATVTTTGSIEPYEDYLTRILPVIWQPVPGGTLLEVHKRLSGVTVNAFSAITPATWHWK